MTTSNIGRVSRRNRNRPARAGRELGRMALAVPAGTIDPNSNDRFRILISGWQVENIGRVTGVVGGHIIVQRRGGFLDSQEISIIEGDWVENAAVPTSRLRTEALNVPVDMSDPRRAIGWEPSALLLNPGTSRPITFSMTIGMDLVAGDSDLDIVAIVDRLPEGSGIKETVSANAFSVGQLTAPVFSPVVSGQALFQVNPF